MTHIIYLPGFGDHYDPLRRIALRRWKDNTTRVSFIPMRWSDKQETYEQKYQRIAKIIEQSAGNDIVIVGESAGGAMALYTFSRHSKEIDRVITICGYNHGARDVHTIHKSRRPAFYRLMPLVDKVVEKFDSDTLRRITTIYSTHDPVVTPRHTRIQNAAEVVLHTPGHFTNITRILLKKPALFEG